LEPTGIGELTVQNKTIDIFSNLSSPGGKAFLELLLPRLNPRNINGGPAMPFQLEVMDMLLLSSSVFWQKKIVFI
jgi:magnesium transporter